MSKIQVTLQEEDLNLIILCMTARLSRLYDAAKTPHHYDTLESLERLVTLLNAELKQVNGE